jgi:hypothetical protein
MCACRNAGRKFDPSDVRVVSVNAPVPILPRVGLHDNNTLTASF